MAFCTPLNLALPKPNMPANDTRIIGPRRKGAPGQVRSEARQEPQQLTLTSRRDAMVCLTTSLVATSLLPTAPAGAHVVNADIMHTIIEKLEKLREMVGLSKPKAELGSGSEDLKPPVTQNAQPMDMLKVLKEKVGISEPKSDSNSNSAETKPSSTQNSQPIELAEKSSSDEGK